MIDDVHYLDLLDVSARIRRRELTSVAVTQALLLRIERLEPSLHTIQLLMADTALEQARLADREIAAGFWRGPLHGVPLGYKDNLWTKDSPTSCGIANRRDHRDPDDATVITRLKEAGAVLLAKLVMTEGAKLDHDPGLPRPCNPWDAAYWSGISSSGSGIAVAAGFVYGSIGMDSGGSIRVPSSTNSVVGIKPSRGRISRYGAYACMPSFDVLGTFARNVGDAAAILQAISGSDPMDITALGGSVPDYSARIGDDLRDITIGIDWDYATGRGIDDEVSRALRDAIAVFQSLGVRMREIKVPWNLERSMTTMPAVVAELTASTVVNYPGMSFGGLTGRGGGDIDPFDVVKGYQDRDLLKAGVDHLFHEVDFIIAPGLGEVIPTWEAVDAIADDMPRLLDRLCRFTTAFNLADVPTLSLPGGFSGNGLPIGIQLAGPRLAEVELMRAGAAFQRATGHHTRRPPVD